MVLVVDGNWLMMSRMYSFEKNMRKDTPDPIKNRAGDDFKSLLARSIVNMLYKFPITNIVVVADGGSWRKELPIPTQLQGTYKGTRNKDTDTDWNFIYKTFETFLDHAGEKVTVSRQRGVEGDDWAWYWSRRINAGGDSCMIWSSDQDLQQLIQVDGNVFTCWYNDRAGLFLPVDMYDDGLEAFMSIGKPDATLLLQCCKQVTYLDPNYIVTSKILCGDSGDNIRPVVRVEKNGRTYGFSKKYYKDLIGDYPTLESFYDHFDEIARRIASLDYFHGDKELIREMMDYNKRLVWLHESVMPDTILTQMARQEYLHCDVDEIKSNYKLLAPEDLGIEDIFGEIL